jgi:hypothetical protein
MAIKNPKLYFEPASQGMCEVQRCQNPAKYRASWAQGIVVKLVCTSHKAEVEGKLFEELVPTIFGSTRHAQ